VEVIRIEVYSPFPAGNTNVYVINGELMIDIGVDDEKVIGKIKKAVDPDAVNLIITHPHADHFGAAYLFKNVSAHKDACKKMFDAEKEYFRLTSIHFALEGMPENLAVKMKEHAEKKYSRFVKPCQNCRKIQKKIKAGDEIFKVLHLPGHSFSHIAIYRRGHLFSGDILLDGLTPNPVIEPIDEEKRHPVLKQYLETIKRLNSMNIVRVYPGHRDFRRNVRDVLKEYVNSFERRSHEIFNACEGRTAFEITLNLFGMNQLFLAMSEVIAHLDFLSENGIIEKKEDRYRKNADPRDLKELWIEIKAETIGEE